MYPSTYEQIKKIHGNGILIIKKKENFKGKLTTSMNLEGIILSEIN